MRILEICVFLDNFPYTTVYFLCTTCKIWSDTSLGIYKQDLIEFSLLWRWVRYASI